MTAAGTSRQRVRGAMLLLEHCAAFERLARGGPSAFSRLEQVLGGELARLLIDALAGDHSMRPRELFV